MMSTIVAEQAPVPQPAYHRAQGRLGPALHVDALTLIRTLHLLSPANVYDAPFARPLLEWAVRLYLIRPRIIRLDAAYWSLRLIAWIHASLYAVAVIPWNRHPAEEPLLLASHLEAREEFGKRSSIERFFGRLFLFFHEAVPACVWQVGHPATGRLNLRCFQHRWLDRSTRGSSRLDPLA